MSPRWLRKLWSAAPVAPLVTEAFHHWFYDSMVWDTLTWAGVKSLKSPMDLWNYQEIIFALQPSLVVEFGTRFGGGTLFFASVLRQMGGTRRLLTVDIDQGTIDPRVAADPNVEVMISSSTSPEVAARIQALRQEFPGPVFAILDSDHRRDHVFAELMLMRPLLKTGDYLIVEDTNINGHPVLPRFGPGPWEALQDYVARFPEDYRRDEKTERKFGFTFAPNGFLIRR